MTSDATARRATGVLLVTCLTSLIVNVNTSAVGILLPSIADDTGASLKTLQWAVSGYSLIAAAVIVTVGAMGDIFGRRKVFIGGISLFVVSCVLIALSKDAGGIIAGRMIQGAAGATILACGMSLLSVASSGSENIKALSIWGASAAVGAALGPLAGGALVDSTGWQGLFWIDAVIAAICIPMTLRMVTESRDEGRSHSIDWAGTGLIALCLSSAILVLSSGSSWGWLSPGALACFAIAIVTAFGFFAVERRVSNPLIDLDLLRNKVLVGSCLVILIAAGAINGFMYVLSLFFQNPASLGMSALVAGLALLPATVVLTVVAPMVSRFADRFGAFRVVVVGMIFMAAGFALIVPITGSWGYGLIIAPIVLVSIGMGLANGPASSASTSSVDERDVGAASGLSNMMRYVGAAVATAAVSAVYNGAQSAHPTASQLADGVSGSALLLAIVSAVGLVALLAMAGRWQPRKDGLAVAAAASAWLHTIHRPRPEEAQSGS